MWGFESPLLHHLFIMIHINYQNLLHFPKHFLSDILSLIFSNSCRSCRTRIDINKYYPLCLDCAESLPYLKKPYCSVCALPLEPGAITEKLKYYECGYCRLEKIYYDRAIACLSYDETVRDLIHDFKFHGYFRLSETFGYLALLKYLYDERYGGEDFIIPVPLHISRSRKRGFNQSALIAAEFSRYTSIPVYTQSVKRIKRTEALYNKSHKERKAILRGVFSVTNPEMIKDRKLLLLDDIYTTGSTVNELSKTLRKAGAAQINVITVARVTE